MTNAVKVVVLWFKSLLLLFSAVSYADSNAPTSELLKETTAETAVWLDVRSFDEYKSGHVDGALNIPHTRIEDNILTAVPDKSAPVFLYCRSGHRSGIALKKMKQLGYTNVVNVGGLNDARKIVNKEKAQ